MKEEWEYKKLGEVASFFRGLTYSGKDEVSFSNNIVLRSNNIDLNTNTINFDELKFISDSIIIPKDKKLKKNSIFMCMSNGSKLHLGKVAFIDKEYPYAFGGFMGLIVPKEDELMPKMAYYYFCSQKFKTHLSSIGNGANINNIKFVDIAKDTIPIPPKSTQLTIVSELDKINELIRLKKEQLKDYDNLAQSIFYKMFGDPVENEKGWEVKKLSSLFKVSSSKRIMQEEWTKEGVPFLKVSDIVSLIRYGEVSPSTFISQLKFEKLEKANMVPMVGDILITSRGTLGLCYTIKTGDKFYFQDGMVTWLSENSGDIIPIYITYLFSNNHFLEVLAGRANKSTVSYISIKQISQKKITIPPLPLQHLFAQRIEQIERQKSAVQKSITDLETLLASRMQYWFE